MLERIACGLEKANEQREILMPQIDDLNAALGTLAQGVSDLSHRVSADLSQLHAELQALQQSQGVDLSGPIASVQNLQATVATIDPAPAPPAPPAPPEPAPAGA